MAVKLSNPQVHQQNPALPGAMEFQLELPGNIIHYLRSTSAEGNFFHFLLSLRAVIINTECAKWVEAIESSRSRAAMITKLLTLLDNVCLLYVVDVLTDFI